MNLKSGDSIKEKDFSSEKELQNQIEKNLKPLLNIEFIDTEFTTSNRGRMDTLGWDVESNSPVIIEYKFDKSKEIINQLIFYYDWLLDHKDTFNRIVKEKIGKESSVNWEDGVRLICIAKDYTEWDFSLITHLNVDIELFTYKYFSNENLILQKLNEIKKSRSITEKKDYDYEFHRERSNEETQKLLDVLRERILNIADDIEENIKQQYVGFKTPLQNFVWLHPRKDKIKIHMRIKPDFFKDEKGLCREIPLNYQWGKNMKELDISDTSDIENTLVLVKQAYESVSK